MPTLNELKKRLASIQMTEQMAGAMKTASAARYAKVSRMLEGFLAYGNAAAAIRDRFGEALGEVWPAENPAAPVCYVLLGANRGLCGGYNLTLYEYADRILEEGGPYLLLVAGRHAAARFRERGVPLAGEFEMPDVPSFGDAEPLLRTAADLYFRGEVSAVVLIWQQFRNMLTQEPVSRTLLPLAPDEGSAEADALCVPDRETVIRAAAEICLRSDYYLRVLEAAAGCQAATLVAMRSAYDNAEESSAVLAADIAHKRQSEVTSSVIETSGGNIRR